MNTLEGSSGLSQPSVGSGKDAQVVLKKALEDFLAGNSQLKMTTAVATSTVSEKVDAESILQSRDFNRILVKVSGTGGLDGPDAIPAPVRPVDGEGAAATVVSVGGGFISDSDGVPGDGDYLLGLCFALMISIMMSMIDASVRSQRSRYDEAKRVYELGVTAAAKVREQSIILLSTAIAGGVIGLSCAAAGLASGLSSCKASKSALGKRIEAHGLNDETPATTGLTAVRRQDGAEGDTPVSGELATDYTERKKQLNFEADGHDVEASSRQAFSDSFRSGGTAGANLIQSTGESVAKRREADKQVMDSQKDLQGVWLQDAGERQNKMSDIVQRASQVAASVIEAQSRIVQAASRG